MDKKDWYKKEIPYCKSKQSNTNHFLLCGSCFWCASSLNLRGLSRIFKCPICKYAFIKSMPIFENEVYKIGYTKKRRFAPESGINL
jgi:hypothetical protein